MMIAATIICSMKNHLSMARLSKLMSQNKTRQDFRSDKNAHASLIQYQAEYHGLPKK